MTETTARADAGSVHDLGAHRAAREAAASPVVSLVKEAPTTVGPVPGTAPAPAAPAAAPLRPVRVWVRGVRAARVAVTDERTQAAGRLAVRHGAYVVAGGGIAARRVWDARSTARYERMMRTAEAAGQHEAAADWEERAQRFRAARHQRRMDLLTAPQRAAKGAAVGTAATAGGLLALGAAVALAEGDPAATLVPLLATIEAIRWVVVIAMVVWGPALTAAPWLALLALWNLGRRRQAAPAWALPAHQRSAEGEPITPSVVVQALRNLGVAALRNAIKDMGDAGAGMLGPIVIAGCGVEVDVTLPSGVSTDEVQNRRRKLAENLTRHEHEVFVTIPEAARTVRLWIADSGALDEPIGPSPLVTDPTASGDYKGGRAPWGQDLRGDAALVSLYQRHMLITGLSNQGKTASLRALALWLALDPTVEFRIGDLKGVGDWKPFEGIATVLIEGPTDDHVAQVVDVLEEGVAEMERRIMAPAGMKFPPLILLVDEAQVAFMCPALSQDDRPLDEKGKPIGAVDKRPLGGTKATSRYFQAARKIHNQGRAVDVLLWQGTQDPTDQNLPKLVREGAHIRASLVLGTESQARMALGDKAVDGGAAPHKLRQGLDKGTVVVAGDGVKLAPGQSATTIRTHYINDEEADQIAERAKALRDGVTTLHAVEAGEERDHLADIAHVVGDAAKLLTQDVLKRLTALSGGVYGDWSHVDLKRALDGTGAEPYKSDGRMNVSRERLHRALANRPEPDSTSALG
ncbi:ATP-binding protein [Streptomyces sp. N2-109]|uniref:ATP-binding protein n=1 Tax=Streptomyces gossypii TaxID=2883101 RepID=A0ABT2JP31_9ACTN|nr:ATP-binding protein [Streptomyces gossypii]MCT2589496.1 ATP-binding protein [Streptomyces gossypii]